MIEKLREDFINIEIQHFNITNCYIMGIVKIEDINRFKEALDNFRTNLYEFETNDENLLEIANMKSKIQHFNTEILEDEEVLSVAYRNEIYVYI